MVNDKTFLLCNNILDNQDYKAVQLANGCFLNYHKRLNIIISENKRICLLGVAWKINEIDDGRGGYSEN